MTKIKQSKTPSSSGSSAVTGCTAGVPMRNYLSFGGGVNSVALYLLMEGLGLDFEAVFVNHGGDWPETYEYVDYFIATGRPVTVLKPEVKTVEKISFDSIIEYMKFRKITPSRISRMCTDRFKIVPVYKYVAKPCFMHIGYAADEAERATINTKKGVENRYLLIEHEITRLGCVEMIEAAGLKVPMKSGCYICPFQGLLQYKELRAKHPDLFCNALKIEEQQNKRVTKEGRRWKPYYLCGVPLGKIDKQLILPTLEKMEYPPCQCGL